MLTRNYRIDAINSSNGKCNLPSVSFDKPVGEENEHPGYTSEVRGSSHLVDLLKAIEGSGCAKDTMVLVTYDEFGGVWDHVAPPAGDLLGPGTRIPALVISPFAKRGFVDHTQYDTASILRLITRRFALPLLPGLAARDQALVAHGAAPMGDLTHALSFDD